MSAVHIWVQYVSVATEVVPGLCGLSSRDQGSIILIIYKYASFAYHRRPEKKGVVVSAVDPTKINL